MTPKFAAAVAFASRLHRAQVRKGSPVPYLSHLLGVASLVMESGGGESECIAALLHDGVEDQGGAKVALEIRRRFGDRVADIVEDCTERRGEGLSWEERKRHSLRRVPRLDAAARLVLTADKLHNVRSLIADLRRLGPSIWDRFSRGREGTLWYYRAMTRALAAAGPSPLLAELECAVGVLDEVAAGRSGLSAPSTAGRRTRRPAREGPSG